MMKTINLLMDLFYSAERNVQILVALLKAHGIRYVIASPGTTNINFVISVQNDPFFKVFSSVDERSAAYLACGIASESGEPVVLSCTGATASRNYVSGLTEAYYRKLPVLAVTSTQNPIRVGHLMPQVIDRSQQLGDMVVESVLLGMVRSSDDEWNCEVKANKALIALRRHGGGPVHINLETAYNQNFSLRELPPTRQIHHIMPHDQFPPLPQEGKIAVFVGSHQPFSPELTQAVDDFCASHDAVVFCDMTSGYHGKYEFHQALITLQFNWNEAPIRPDLLIHIGEVSGDDSMNLLVPKKLWRVSPDGELRDRFRRLSHVFEMEEITFFKHYVTDSKPRTDYLDACLTYHQQALFSGGSINAGDYVALVGPSGCGKSTLVRLMLGFEQAESGSIFFDEHNLDDINKPSLRRYCISICLQDGQLVEGTIRDNILFGNGSYSDEDVWEAAKNAALDKDIEAMPRGLDTPISADGQGVSGGQRQRILIARALIRKPKIFFLDEATSALDNISQHIITENLARMRCTRITIAHRMSTIRECNRIIVLGDGKVAEDGSYDELLAKGGLFSEIIKRQTA